jgi:hypothetical protein
LKFNSNPQQYPSADNKKRGLWLKPKQSSINHEGHEDNEKRVAEFLGATFVAFVIFVVQ